MKTAHCPSLLLAPKHRRAISFLVPPREGHKVPSQSVADWIAEINRLVKVTKVNYLEVARVVFAAKRNLPRGQWSAMWECAHAPFKKGKADALISVGKNLGDVNAQTSEHLPQGWTTL